MSVLPHPSAMRRIPLIPLIIYLILFLPGILTAPGDNAAPIAFSLSQYLTRLFTYTLPALALVAFLIIRGEATRPFLRFHLRDVPVCLLCLAALTGVAFLLTTLAAQVPLAVRFASQPPKFEVPQDVASWVTLAVFCLGTGYLEEGFFRLYLPSQIETAGFGKTTALLGPALLFAVCHRYEGLWGVLNAVVAALSLSFALARTRSFHGIALAHGIYNTLAMML
jgi:membrane protease YdiL (CAAX protease family)